MHRVLWLSIAIILSSFIFEGAGCSGAEIQSAKLYRSQRNYDKANDMLEKALSKNPTDDEAWTIYVQNLYDLKRFEKIAEVIDTAVLYAVTHRPIVEDFRHNAWVELYNGGLKTFQMNPEAKENQQ